MCKISIILPSLNVRAYIGECLQSAVDQTLKDIEIICVDAGSTDGTLEVIRSFAARDDRVKLILSEKKSYGYQMNLGIAQACGEYIGILETDDFIPAVMYEELYAIAQQHQAEIVKADFYRFRKVNGRLERSYNRLDPSNACYGRIIDPAQETQVFRLIMNTWSGIYEREFLEHHRIKHNESPGASYQDTGFWFQTFCCAQRIYFVDKPYYMNRRDNIHSSVFNTGKVYCMTDEWKFIHRWLEQDAQRFQTFLGPYALRKYHSLLTTYQRIAPESREAFICHMSEEMGKTLARKEYVKSAFTHYEWKWLQLIVTAPLRYHQIRLSGCSHFFAVRLLEKFKRRKKISRIIRRADQQLNRLEILLSWILYEGVRKTWCRTQWKKRARFSL